MAWIRVGGEAVPPADPRDVGAWAHAVAIRLWPEIKLAPAGSEVDMLGVDGWINAEPVQIKGDRKIDSTTNILFEFAKRNTGWQRYGAAGEWRHSPAHAVWYVFIGNALACRVRFAQLVETIRNKPVREVKESSIGWVIPLSAIGHQGGTIISHRYPFTSPPERNGS